MYFHHSFPCSFKGILYSKTYMCKQILHLQFIGQSSIIYDKNVIRCYDNGQHSIFVIPIEFRSFNGIIRSVKATWMYWHRKTLGRKQQSLWWWFNASRLCDNIFILGSACELIFNILSKICCINLNHNIVFNKWDEVTFYLKIWYEITWIFCFASLVYKQILINPVYSVPHGWLI